MSAPLAATAQVRIGKYLLDRSRPAEAEAELNQVLAGFADQPEAVFWATLFLIDAARSQGRQSEAWAVAERLIDDASLAFDQHAWAKVKYAERQLDKGLRGPAAEELRQVISIAAPGSDEPRNWARVRLAETATLNWAPNDAIAICDAILADHGAGKADDEQAAWGLIWKARSHKQLVQYTQAAESLQMAIALVHGKFPAVAFDAWFELGEIQRMDEQHEPALTTYRVALEEAMSHELPEGKVDLARLQVGSEMRHLGMRERGIAWLRMGIEDPADLKGSDQLLAERMASFMTPEEAEAWQQYLLAPAQMPDPTNTFVQNEFRSNSPSPSSAWVNSLSSRQSWLGRLLEHQGRFHEAGSIYAEAVSQASTTREKAEALSGLARALTGQVEVVPALQGDTITEEADAERGQLVEALRGQARGYMAEATQQWLQHAMQSTPGDSHHATEQAVQGWATIGMNVQALVTAGVFQRELASSGAPASKIAFARLMEARALIWNLQFPQAVDAGMELHDFTVAQDSSLVDLESLRVLSLVDLAGYLTLAGEPHEGLDILGQLKEQYGLKYHKWIAPQKDAIRSFLRVQ